MPAPSHLSLLRAAILHALGMTLATSCTDRPVGDTADGTTSETTAATTTTATTAVTTAATTTATTAAGEFIRTIAEARRPKVRYVLTPGRLQNWTLPTMLPHSWVDGLVGNMLAPAK